MRLKFWRCEARTAAPLPRQPRNERPAWATQRTDVFPTNDPGRAGNLTRAQEFRANGGRW